MKYDRGSMLERLEESTRTLTPPEVAEVIGRSSRSVYDLIERGDFGEVEITPAGRKRIPYRNIERYIKIAGVA